MSVLAKGYWTAFTAWHVRGERKLPYLPQDRIREIQQQRLRSLVEHAWAHVPHYREAMEQQGLRPRDFRTADDLARLPLIDGRRLVERPERFLAVGAMKGGLRIDSSGTSGRSKSIHHDRAALFLALAHGHRQRLVLEAFVERAFGYREMHFARPGGVPVQLRRFYAANSWMPQRIELDRRLVAPGGATAEAQIAEVNRFRPAVVRGYGSYLGWLFRTAWERCLDFERPKAIVYGADSMPESDREVIEEKLGIPVLSTYQSVEALRIGFQCAERKGFHLSTDAIAFRVVDEAGVSVGPGGTGHLVISNLTNHATVLLNYKLGDMVTLGRGPCPCGRTLPLIERIRGRSDDLVRLPGGAVSHALVVLEGLRAVSGVVQVQLLQEDVNRFVIRAVSSRAANLSAASEALVAALCQRVSPEVKAEVQWMEAIPAEPGGKTRAVIDLGARHAE